MGAGMVGAVAVRLALVAAVAAVVVAIAAARRPTPAARRWTERLPLAVMASVSVALAALLWALAAGDFGLAYVADATNRTTSWPYRLAGVWAGMGGSLLFWVWVLSLYAWVVPRRAAAGTAPPTAVAATTAGLAGLVAAFLGIVVALADPFRSLAIPAIDGAGLTPILEHPAMLYHPPLLYGGVVGCAAPAALVAAGLLTGWRDGRWLALVRRWAAVSWLLLTVGLLAGAHWAYVELGWGGFWAWDPVENGGLLPWLGLTALLHAVMVDERRRTPGRTVPALALATLGLALLGTLLTRSGATTSVHAFAENRTVGRALLGLLVVVLAAGAWLLTRAPAGERQVPRLPWRARLLRTNTVVLGAVTLVVLWGTVFPLLAQLLGGDGRAVDGRFFALFTAPLALAVVGLAAVAPRRPSGRVVAPALVGATAGLALLAVSGARSPWALLAGVVGGASAGAVVVDLLDRRAARTARRVGGRIAHLGVALLLLAVAGTTGGTTRTVVVPPGGEAVIGGYAVRHDGVSVGDAGDHRVVTASVTLLRGDERVASLHPASKVYERRGLVLAETALRSTPVEDVLVALRQAGDDGRLVLEVTVRPLVWWVWWAGLLLAGGAGLALLAPPPAARSRVAPLPLALEEASDRR